MRTSNARIDRPADAVRLARARQLASSGEGRRRRVRAGLSVRQVAAGSGTTHTTVIRWEAGRSQPSGPAALRWAELLARLTVTAKCSCERFGNGVVSGVVDPPAPGGALLNSECPVHSVTERVERILASAGGEEAINAGARVLQGESGSEIVAYFDAKAVLAAVLTLTVENGEPWLLVNGESP